MRIGVKKWMRNYNMRTIKINLDVSVLIIKIWKFLKKSCLQKLKDRFQKNIEKAGKNLLNNIMLIIKILELIMKQKQH